MFARPAKFLSRPASSRFYTLMPLLLFTQRNLLNGIVNLFVFSVDEGLALPFVEPTTF